MSSATVLVTGGAGFIGSHVVDSLIAMEYDVVALDDLTGGTTANVNPRARFIEGSVADHVLIDRIFQRERFTYVFHLAAYAAEGLSHFIRRFNYDNNLIGSVNLINASVNVGTIQCFVFTSSIAVYGKGQLPMSEGVIPQPEDPYGIAKLAVEQDLAAAHEMFGLPYIVFRPHNVYGPRQNLHDKYRNVLGIFMNQALCGDPFTIFGDGTQTRAFSYVDDVAPIIAHSVRRPQTYNQVYNVGAEEAYSVNDLASVVAEAMGVKLQVKHLEPRKEVLHAYSSHAKARAAFGDLMTNIGLRDGVEQMAAWAKLQNGRKASSSPAIEVDKNMPPSWAPSGELLKRATAGREP